MTQDTLPSLVGRLLQKNSIAFDKRELAFQIKSHPSYPSLHAITGVLDHFKIENVAASIPTDEASLSQLPDNFMAQVERDLVIATRKKKGFQVYDASLNKSTWSTTEFLEKFSGVVVAVESTEDTSPNSKTDYSYNIMLGAVGLVLLTFFFVSNPAPALLFFFALGIVGTAISVAILKQEFGMSTALGSAFCSDASEKKDCDAVLNSEGATVLGKYKFSDLSIVYFLTLALTSTLTIIQGGSLTAGYYLSLLSLPISLYSIYYQRVVVKKWCLLCLSIVGVLWAQAGVAIFMTELSTPLSLNGTLLLSLVGLVIFAAWTYLRPRLEDFQTNQKAHIDYFRFKRNFELFSTLLHKEKTIDTAFSASSEIVFGNQQATTVITIVTNPFCGHCKPVHTLIEDILGKYHDMVKVIIRFNIRLEDEESDVVKIATRLLEIYEKQGKDLCLMAMGEIYGESKVEDWLAKWSVCSDPKHYLKPLQAGNDWCHTHKINFTPEVLINGQSFPGAYPRTDLIYFIEDLHEADLAKTATGPEAPEEVMV